MCGILAVLTQNNKLNLRKADSALSTLSHRGPDHKGHWTNTSNAYLGHTRLSIIDVSEASNQPFFSSDGKYCIVFNGEIYNYRELRTSLNSTLRTSSDTEVILTGYMNQGIDFFKKMRGIYAFVILELGESQKAIAVRDPSGVKPLYYSFTKGDLVFASEIKAISTYKKSELSINFPCLHTYLNTGYCAEPQTAFEQILALRPGQVATYENNKLAFSTFFPIQIRQFNQYSFQENLELAENKLKSAVERNLVSDVGCSVALSGGIDSSLIYHFSHQLDKDINAITVAFNDKKYDESEVSKQYTSIKGGSHHLIDVGIEFDKAKLDQLLDHFDQPYADTSLIPTYYLTKACKNYTKVLLGGDGGDELFNGYPFMHRAKFLFKTPGLNPLFKTAQHLKNILPDEITRKISRLEGIVNVPILEALYNMNSWLPSNTTWDGKSIFNKNQSLGFENLKHLFADEQPEKIEDIITFFQYRYILLSDYLRKTDMMSMINGIEYRVPFLDEDMVDFAYSIPFEQKSKLRTTKFMLRKLHEQHFSGYASNNKKWGFGIPLDNYLNLETKKSIIESITAENSFVLEFINKGYLNFLIQQFLNYNCKSNISRMGVYQRIILLYSLQRWHDNNF